MEDIIKQKKKLELHGNQSYDRLIEYRKEPNDDLLKMHIRSLFAIFSGQ